MIHQLAIMYKIVAKATSPYLYELLPSTVNQRSNRSLRSGHNLSPFSCRIERFKSSFFPATVNKWNSLDIEMRESKSLGFKNQICDKFCTTKYNKLFNFSISRCASILHTRLRLVCPNYAAQREVLLASAADILGNVWINGKLKQKLNWLLNGCNNLNVNDNCKLFSAVQQYIVDTKPF